MWKNWSKYVFFIASLLAFAATLLLIALSLRYFSEAGWTLRGDGDWGIACLLGALACGIAGEMAWQDSWDEIRNEFIFWWKYHRYH